MQTREEIINYGLSFPNTYNIKVDPEWRDVWRSLYPAVQPGYHQNKAHWNTVILDGTVP